MIRNDNLFKDAGEFLDKFIDRDKFEKALVEYFKKNEFNENERHLFVYHLGGQLELTGCIAKLKTKL